MLQQLLRLKEKGSADLDGKELKYQIHDFEKNTYEIDLPQMRTVFPRFRKLPEAVKMTKWEKFAQEKGIDKKVKRSRMVWDEISNDWVPRWGPGSKKKIAARADVIRPVKTGYDPKADPWEKEKIEKELLANRQKQAEAKNKLHKANIKPSVLKKMEQKEQKQQVEFTKRNNQKEKKGANLKQKKTALTRNLLIAQNSTASMGKFDKKAHKQEVQKKIKKKNKSANFKTLGDEKTRNVDVLNSVMRNMK